MPSMIIIRLHPETPTDFTTFQKFLDGPSPPTTRLAIAVRDMSFSNPTATNNVIGTARYDPGKPDTTILQHPGTAAATAVVVIDPAKLPPGYPEYDTSDLRLTITRGTQTIADNSLNYNVGIHVGPLPPLAAYPTLTPVGLYLALPAVDPSRAYVPIPTDGSPPAYDDLLAAVQKVYAKDPGGTFDINSPPLTAAQARHIAYEIVSNRDLNPLPDIPNGDTIDQLYTTGGGKDDDRQKFEGQLSSYYATIDTQAGVMAKYVMALSAALACERRTNAATNAGFDLPVLPGVGGTGDTDVILSG